MDSDATGYHRNVIHPLSIGDNDAEFLANDLVALDSLEASADEQSPPGAFHINPLFDASHFGTADLTSLEDTPDINVPPNRPGNLIDLTRVGDPKLVAEEACLQMVLDVFPDISVDYVLTLIKGHTQAHTPTPAACERIVSQLLDGGDYPKEQDEANKRKRKRNDDEDLSDYDRGEPDIGASPSYQHDALSILKDEFLDVPERHISTVLEEQKTLFKAYGIIEQQVSNYSSLVVPYRKLRNPRKKRGVESTLIELGSTIPKELHATKRKSENEAVKRRKAMEAECAEEDNLRQAQMNNEMGECLCCFDDFPLNRMASCTGETVHHFCLPCAKKYVEGEMGNSRCRPVCFADPNCGGTFSRWELLRFLNEKSFERLEHMQQQEDLAAAGLDFLSECPFCDYKEEYPPVEVNREFRCQIPKCKKISCRLCQKETHIPLSCEEAKENEKSTVRHVVEEAMSAALIRYCNQCKHPFVKDYGCNKMTCSHCHNVQCYVCSKDVHDYNHFTGQNQCPVYDDVENRHEEEVKKAANEAMAKVRAENPHMSEADLTIQVSSRVKQAEQSRRARAQIDNDYEEDAVVPFHRLYNAIQPAQDVHIPQAPAAAVQTFPPLPMYQNAAARQVPLPRPGFAMPFNVPQFNLPILFGGAPAPPALPQLHPVQPYAHPPVQQILGRAQDMHRQVQQVHQRLQDDLLRIHEHRDWLNALAQTQEHRDRLNALGHVQEHHDRLNALGQVQEHRNRLNAFERMRLILQDQNNQRRGQMGRFL